MGYIKKKSAIQEKRTAKEFGGKTQVASGALWGSKGDVRTGAERTSSFNDSDYLIENKYTDKDSYKLDRKIWEKIVQEALRDNFRTPLLQVDIQDLQLIIISHNDFTVLFEGYNNIEYRMFSTENNSIVLKKKELNRSINASLGDSKIPVFVIEFLEKVGEKRYLKLAMMLKEEYLTACNI